MRIESVTLSTGEIVMIVTDPAFRIDLAVLRTMVTEGGATLRGIALEGCGTLVEEAGAWTWRVSGSGQEIAVDIQAEDVLQEARRAAGHERHIATGRLDIPEQGEIPLRLIGERIVQVKIE